MCFGPALFLAQKITATVRKWTAINGGPAAILIGMTLGKTTHIGIMKDDTRLDVVDKAALTNGKERRRGGRPLDARPETVPPPARR